MMNTSGNGIAMTFPVSDIILTWRKHSIYFFFRESFLHQFDSNITFTNSLYDIGPNPHLHHHVFIVSDRRQESFHISLIGFSRNIFEQFRAWWRISSNVVRETKFEVHFAFDDEGYMCYTIRIEIIHTNKYAYRYSSHDFRSWTSCHRTLSISGTSAQGLWYRSKSAYGYIERHSNSGCRRTRSKINPVAVEASKDFCSFSAKIVHKEYTENMENCEIPHSGKIFFRTWLTKGKIRWKNRVDEREVYDRIIG